MSEHAERLKQLVSEIHGGHHVGDAQHTKLKEIERMIDAQDAQIDVAVSGYKAAVRTAQWQAVTNSELNAAMSYRIKLTEVEQQRDELLAALTHAVEIAEAKRDGTWDDVMAYRALIAKAES